MAEKWQSIHMEQVYTLPCVWYDMLCNHFSPLYSLKHTFITYLS